MKKYIIALILIFLIVKNVDAQQNTKSHFMMVTIHGGSQSYHPEMIVTNEDGKQQITRAAKKSWMNTGQTFDIQDGKIAQNEDSLFLTLKTFFDAGWKLVSSNIIKNDRQ